MIETLLENPIKLGESNVYTTAEIALKIMQHKSALSLARILVPFEPELALPLFLEALYQFFPLILLKQWEEVKIAMVCRNCRFSFFEKKDLLLFAKLVKSVFLHGVHSFAHLRKLKRFAVRLFCVLISFRKVMERAK